MIIRPFREIEPVIAADAFIAEGAVVIGDVHIGQGSGIWFGSVVRGDVNHVRIGDRTNIQDGTIVHVTRVKYPTIIGNDVTIGHAAMIHGCVLEDACFVGMRATVMDGAVVESGAWVAAGALVSPGKRIPKGEVWAGVPAKFMRKMTAEEEAYILVSSRNYAELAAEYRRASTLP
jgi:carbonic anhydrase/acetyltransferase-like protein (isoleucine patch superfamily)